MLIKEQIRFYAEVALLFALFSALIGVGYYRNAYRAEHAEFTLFKSQTEMIGEQAKRDKKDQEEKWKKQFTEQEKAYAALLAKDRIRFAAERERLRSSATGSTSESGLPEAGSIGVCIDKAGNDRLFNTLSGYREEERRSQIETLQLIEICQFQTNTLVSCQEKLEAIVFPSN
jgi:hypothetical protein